MASEPAPRILIVDDEGAVRHPLQIAFEGEGWVVDTADAFEPALELLKTHAYDLLLTDKNLPEKTGLDLARELQADGRDVPVLIMTGYPSVDSAIDSLHLGVEGYIRKPFDDIFEVVEQAKELLDQSRRRQESRERAVERMATATAHFNKATAFLQSATERGEAPVSLNMLVAMTGGTDRQWVVSNLGQRGDDITSVDSASELLSQVAKRAPDFVLVDLDLAGDDIFDVITNISRAAADTACVVACHAPPIESVMRLIELKVRALVERPFDEASFRDKVWAVVENVRRQRALESDEKGAKL